MKLSHISISVFTVLLLFSSCKSSKNTIQKPTSIDTTVSDSIAITKDTLNTYVAKNIPLPSESPIIIEDSHETEVSDSYHVDNVLEKFDHTIFNNLLLENVSESGVINYRGFISNKILFKSYLSLLSENIPKENWTKEDKLAYWMNTYNAFTIKLIIDNYPTKSIKDIKNAWDSRFFKLGKKWYNLSDVEHKILRKMDDPRIHFGINCASFSCPPLLNRAFTASTINTDLEFLAHQFINDKSRNTISENNIQLSKIFKWYSNDFETEGSLIKFLNNYSDIKINSTAKKSFKKYDWNLNE
jgi:hypothetical protein